MTEHVTTLKSELPATAFRMRQALDYIAAHPGVTKTEVRRACDVYENPYLGADSVRRLLRRGMVVNLGRVNRARLYVIDLSERDSGVFHHP